jgi:hypothetical protein
VLALSQKDRCVKKSDPIVVIPIGKHIRKSGVPTTIPVIKSCADQKLVFNVQARGLLDETPSRQAKNRLFVGEEKVNQILVMVEEHGNATQQMGLAHAREKFEWIGQFIPLHESIRFVRSRRKRQLREDFRSSDVWTRGNLSGQHLKWNLYPSRYFQTEICDTVFADHDGRVWLRYLLHDGAAQPCATSHNRDDGKPHSNTDDRGNTACKSQTATRTTCTTKYILRSDSPKNSLTESVGSKNERQN